MSNPILKLNTKQWKILTPFGFEPFEGVSYNGEKQTLHVRFANNNYLDATFSHILFANGREVQAKQLKPGMVVDGNSCKRSRTVVSVSINNKPQRVFDVVQTPSHTYFVNDGVKSHNCRFISSDPLLIDTMKAQILKSEQPIATNMGISIWQYFDPQDTAYDDNVQPVEQPGVFDNWHRNPVQQFVEKQYTKSCIITVDPSKGVGGDYTCIQVWSYPQLQQMMELRSNITKTGEIYRILKYLWKKADKAGWQVLFTVENNGVGEGLVTLFENDNSLPENVEIVSDEGKQLGMSTTNGVKLQACRIFKEFVESGKLKIRSKELIKEIKTFAKVGGTYAAQPGGTDDCVMATLLVCRVVKTIAAYDDDAFNSLYEVNEIDDSGDELLGVYDGIENDGFGGAEGDDEMPITF